MKVCTDACILGAWVAEAVASGQLQATRCLDIGAGTGLLSLMLAQKSSAKITSIEIDKNAFTQAIDNFKTSLWSERLKALHTDAKNYYEDRKYDLIISNPPFFEDDLLSPAKIKNVAKHDESLKLNELILVIKRNLDSKGNFAVLLPFRRVNYFEGIAIENVFFLKEKLLIKHTAYHNYFRSILIFSKLKIDSPFIKELVIKNKEGSYTDDFAELMSDYYLE